jgi:hypothetical protein
MALNFGYTLVDAYTAVCPLPDIGRDWQVSGVSGDEAMFQAPDGTERTVKLPFYDEATCSTKAFTVEGPQGEPPTSFWLMFPEPHGSQRLEVRIECNKGLWFAVAHVQPAKKR